MQDSRIGQVLADKDGKTIYLYQCNDDAMDQQTCDHPASPQVYRMAICGNFNRAGVSGHVPVCESLGRREERQQAVDGRDDRSQHRQVGEGQGDAGATQVWAYRGRPVYTYGEDMKPGDANGDNYGEFNGQRNGFKAFWVRDDYRNNNIGRTANDR